MVAATVVETFIRIEAQASERRRRILLTGMSPT
jgi:hypothetical protein